MRQAIYENEALLESVHWTQEGFPATSGQTGVAEVRALLDKHGFVKLSSFVSPLCLARARAAVTEALISPRTNPGTWRDLTLGGPIQELARGYWIEQVMAGIFGQTARAERATYVRAVRQGGSKLHIDAPRQNGPEGRVLKVWIALSDISAGDGSLFILPDPHRRAGPLACERPMVDKTWGRIDEIHRDGLAVWLERNKTLLRSVPCRTGDAIIFDGITIHGSFAKTGTPDQPRLSCDTGWQADDPLSREFTGPTAQDVDSYRCFVGSPGSW